LEQSKTMQTKLNTKSCYLLLAGLLALTLILGACATPTPETIVQTVEVEKEVVKTVEVKPELPSEYSEAPQLAELVAAGDLPPIDERLPENPLVVLPVKSVGQYGGTWHRGWRGINDFHCFGRIRQVAAQAGLAMPR
jgi:hypothetical protein